MPLLARLSHTRQLVADRGWDSWWRCIRHDSAPHYPSGDPDADQHQDQPPYICTQQRLLEKKYRLPRFLRQISLLRLIARNRFLADVESFLSAQRSTAMADRQPRFPKTTSLQPRLALLRPVSAFQLVMAFRFVAADNFPHLYFRLRAIRILALLGDEPEFHVLRWWSR
ncbi:hypothetical protein LCGC14_1112760 [marine sediment metagenome]|uniref:Uncharacterized protein n=1 Tax=marine sediment metagenome TaxID=412755 RepID=A0A0F9QCC2_9ZZZZ